MASRIIVAVELTPPAKEAVETLTRKHGMPQVAMISRLVEWLDKQPETIRRLALSHDPAANVAASAELILKCMATGK